MKTFKQILFESNEKKIPSTLGDLIKVGTNMEDAHFWVVRRGDINKIGHPTKEFNKEHFEVKVTREDLLDPRYAYYMMQHIANTGHFKNSAVGSTNIMNIRSSHITDIPIR